MAIAAFFPGMDSSPWWLALAAAAGFCAAALPFVVGRALMRRTAAPEDGAVKGQVEEPDRDPFVYGSRSEQRSCARRAGGIKEVLITDPAIKGAPWRGQVLDRSLGGLCLGVDRMVPPGTIVAVRTVDAPMVAPWIEVEVRSCREGSDGWELGCQFVRTPPSGLLMLFG